MTKGTDFGLYEGRDLEEKNLAVQRNIAMNLKILNDNLHELIEGFRNRKFTIITGSVA